MGQLSFNLPICINEKYKPVKYDQKYIFVTKKWNKFFKS